MSAASGSVRLEEALGRLLARAVRGQASDIHIEPDSHGQAKVRLRVDGLLREDPGCGEVPCARMAACLKMMARLDIAERRLPQDGQFSFGPPGRSVSVRVSTLPTLRGEKLVLRLLRSDGFPHLEALGLPDTLRREFLRQLRQPQGLILLTGPTGSGKTMTLYGALGSLDSCGLNICSVEDPVEMPLPSLSQCQVNRKARLDFPTLLRALLRQDPDVIMIGEIRDRETAAIAVGAAQTGHLVLASLHTPSGHGVLPRLSQLGLPPALLRPALRMVMAQRLVRRLCPSCRRPRMLNEQAGAQPGGKPKPGWRAVGCDDCYQGYAGRRGLFELLKGAECLAPLKAIQNPASSGLWLAGLELVAQGETSLEELDRVLGTSP